jgi:hypothetical protein
VESDNGVYTVHCEQKHSVGEDLWLLVRPQVVEDQQNRIRGIVSDVIFQQDRFKVTLDNELYAYLPNAVQVGEKIEVPVKVECLA